MRKNIHPKYQTLIGLALAILGHILQALSSNVADTIGVFMALIGYVVILFGLVSLISLAIKRIKK